MPEAEPYSPEEIALPWREWWEQHVERAFEIGNTEKALREVRERYNATLAAVERERDEARRESKMHTEERMKEIEYGEGVRADLERAEGLLRECFDDGDCGCDVYVCRGTCLPARVDAFLTRPDEQRHRAQPQPEEE